MARRGAVPPDWSVMEHRAIMYPPSPLGLPFYPAVMLITTTAISMAAFGMFVVPLGITGSLFWLGKMLTGWHPFGWQIMIKSFSTPRVLWA